MDTSSRRVHHLMETLWGLFDRRLSPSQKLVGLAILASIVAVSIGRWGLLIVLIVTMLLFAYLTDRMLTVGWLTSRDPLTQVLGGLERCQETVASGYRHVFNANNVPDSGTQELRKRSESIASSHIPDLDIDVESSSSGSTFQKKIRLELNSIILLIIRDFVQFWYNKFSYNSQFLKDARQFLFKGFHNFVERISRLGPHKTSAKLIHAYRKHLASFQTAQSMFHHQEKQNIHTSTRTRLTRLESVDEAFPLNFQFHPALKNKEAEKQYLRSLTKVILLCSCSRDVVSAQSAQLFFIEVLSMNVLLPVVEMLSTPDRLYEMIIKLTYNDDTILNDNTIKELIDVEVKRMQLRNARILGPTVTISHQGLLETCENLNACTDKPDASQNFGQCATASSDVDKVQCSKPSTKVSKVSESMTAGQGTRRKSKTYDDTAVLQNSDHMEELVPEVTGNCTSPQLDTQDSADKSGSCSSVQKSEEASVTDSTECAEFGAENTHTDQTRKSSEASEINDLEIVVEETQEDLDKSPSSNSVKSIPAQNNHIYDEIVSTGVPIIKPKLQVFKDLFKSKKSKQAEENKTQNASTDKDQSTEGQKSQSEPMPKSFSESSILPTPRLKSLRLSPLLNRSGKFGLSSDSTSSTANKNGKDSGAKSKASATDLGSERQTPSPQPTPSPSQPSKGGPLSFFKFRKPTLDFRKSSSAAVEEKTADAVSDLTPSTRSEDNALTSDQTPTPSSSSSAPVVPSVQVSSEDSRGARESNGPLSSKNKSPSSPTWGSNPGAAEPPPRGHSLNVSSYMEISPLTDGDLKTPTLQSGNCKLFLGSSGEEVEEGEEAECLAGGGGGGEDEGPLAMPPDSSLIFQDISIHSTMICQEFRSNSQFTVYQIEYEALHFSETGIPVMKTGTAKRRYREFVNLMSRLEDNAAYKRLLKDVKGPKRWLTLPFKNMDRESVASRQKALEQFLKSLIEVEAVCNGPEMREFLAYEGDSHIAFVKKSTEINVPRIDKMLARTVSGVFDKLKSLPNLPQEVISGIRGRETLVDRKDSGAETDADSICVVTDFAHDYAHDLSFYNMLREVSENYVRDVQTLGHPELLPASPTSQLLKVMTSSLYDQILLQLPRVEGDGAEHPDDTTEGGGQLSLGSVGSGQLLLCDAVLDLTVQLLMGQPHWLGHQRTLTALRNVLGRTLDRWVRETVSSLTTAERCLYYIRLLRETVWPGGQLFSTASTTTSRDQDEEDNDNDDDNNEGEGNGDGAEEEGEEKKKEKKKAKKEKSEEEKVATQRVAQRLLVNFFPGSLTMLLGSDSLETGVEVIMESLQYSQLNKHFLYTTIDMLLESLFPEVGDPQFQGRLLPRP